MPNIEEQIRRAMAEGKFSNLKGKGKPLNLDQNPFEDPGWRPAYRLLKNAGFTLPWIETRQEIEKDLEAARERLARAWAWKQGAAARRETPADSQADWERAATLFRKQVEELNKRIRSYN